MRSNTATVALSALVLLLQIARSTQIIYFHVRTSVPDNALNFNFSDNTQDRLSCTSMNMRLATTVDVIVRPYPNRQSSNCLCRFVRSDTWPYYYNLTIARFAFPESINGQCLHPSYPKTYTAEDVYSFNSSSGQQQDGWDFTIFTSQRQMTLYWKDGERTWDNHCPSSVRILQFSQFEVTHFAMDCHEETHDFGVRSGMTTPGSPWRRRTTAKADDDINPSSPAIISIYTVLGLFLCVVACCYCARKINSSRKHMQRPRQQQQTHENMTSTWWHPRLRANEGNGVWHVTPLTRLTSPPGMRGGQTRTTNAMRVGSNARQPRRARQTSSNAFRSNTRNATNASFLSANERTGVWYTAQRTVSADDVRAGDINATATTPGNSRIGLPTYSEVMDMTRDEHPPTYSQISK